MTASGIVAEPYQELLPTYEEAQATLYDCFEQVILNKNDYLLHEGIPVTNIYYGLSWFAILLSIVLLTVGLWNAELTKSEKGFYAMAFILSIFSAIAVQKNIRDVKATKPADES
ncbi:MAG: hypothetical protein JST09_16570 [Bacteroidetes bacterium]|nr:hypothetical protein [Bacteroidota bacterium]